MPRSLEDNPPAAPVDTNANIRRVFWTGCTIGLAACISLVARPVVERVAEMHELGQVAHPYFQPTHAGLLYLLFPLVFLSGLLFLLSPGILAVLAIGRSRTLCPFLLQVCGVTFVVLVGLIVLADLMFPPNLPDSLFLTVLWVVAGLEWLWLYSNARHGAGISWPLSDRADRRQLLSMGATVLIGTILLLPKLCWENFNEDGAEYYFFSESLSTHILPVSRMVDPPVAVDTKWILPMYFVRWMQMLFGPVEASARLPFLLWLVLLFAAVVALAEWNLPRRLSWRMETCLWLGLATIAVTVAYNASYNPWFSDLAMPGTSDLILPVLLVGAVHFLWAGRYGWFALLAGLSFFVRPTAPMLLVLVGGFGFWLDPEHRWRRIGVIAAAIMISASVAFLVESRLTSAGMYSAENLVGRMRFIRLDDVPRLAYLLVPGGILPGLSLLAWRWQDRLSRVITLTTLAYFLFFYVVAFVVLHHFIPAMVFPLVVFWRILLQAPEKIQSRVLLACALTSVAAFWFSLPLHFRIANAERELGSMLEFRGLRGDSLNQAMLLSKGMSVLFPPVSAVRDPTRMWGVKASPVVFYGAKPKPLGSAVNYVLQPASVPPPVGFTRAGDSGGVTAYVCDSQLWAAHKRPSMPGRYQSPLYAMSPEEIFPKLGAESQGIIDLRKLLGRLPEAIR